jgi:Chaperonin 10 Kd subunit
VPAHRIYVHELRDGFDYIGENGKPAERDDISLTVRNERRTWQPAQEVRGREVIPLDVKAGDKILFGKYSAVEIKLNGEEHLILREDDILEVIEK